MIEAASSIKHFERQVMWRERLLALQDRVALAILVSCVVAAGFILLARLKEGGSIPWPVVIAILVVELGALLFNWVATRAGERDAAFVIDDRLEMEDRLITAHEIIERGGPKKVVETALIEDAASRVADRRASSVVPYRLKRWHALSLVGVALLVAAMMIPEKALPGGEAIAEARADIQAAGEQLEQTATEAEQIAPAGSETAKLASEQAELGRSFRRSNESRAEALKKLSALEGRIRERHDVLASTRADEIVNAAEQRLRSAISSRPKQRSQAEANENGDALQQPEDASGAAASADAKESRQKSPDKGESPSLKSSSKAESARVKPDSAKPSNSNSGDVTAARNAVRPPEQKQSNANQAAGKPAPAANAQPDSQSQAGQPKPQNPLQEPVSSPNAQPTPASKDDTNAQKERGQNATEANGGEKGEGRKGGDQKDGAQKEGDQKGDDQKGQGNDEQKPDGGLPATNPLGGLMAEQAVKALPQMSEELMKKAAQLRAGELSADDIKRLAQAAQFLARDLNQIAQSKELQQALEQMVRQINPEQIEQVARQLMNQEQLKRELEAAARLMMQNQQAKEMVAGIKQSVENIAKQFRGPEDGPQPDRARGRNGEGGKGNAGGDSRLQLGKPSDGQKLKGQGKESNVAGNLQRRAGGEYLYLQTQAGAGAARAPYSSAYPQYRREAERSVQRSQVPPHMRSVVRSYFDAINPDASKKP